MSLLRKVNAEKYSEGQVWSYKTRRGEEESKFIIVKIEKDMRQRKIFHLCIEKVRIKNPRVAGGFSSYIAHIPVSEKILDEDCLKVVDIRKNLPDISNNYKEWKDQKGGVFAIPIKQIVQNIEDMINNCK